MLLRLTSIILLLLSLSTQATITPAALESSQLLAQRQYYLNAKKALLADDIGSYQQLRKQLADYPLLPYLDYQQLYHRIDTDPYQDVDIFLDQNQNSYLGQLFLRQWLDYLASQQRWHEYLSYFDDALNSSTHQCLHLWSRFKTGDRNALNEVGQLWDTGRSQPDECDALFTQWQQAGYLTKEIAWSRYQKAIIGNNAKLSRYMQKLMPVDMRTLATQFNEVWRNPALLEKISNFQQTTSEITDTIYHGLNRYARSNPDQAIVLWENYSHTHTFTSNQTNSFHYTLAKQYAYANNGEQSRKLLDSLSSEQQVRVIEINVRNLLKQQNWVALIDWLQLLPADERQTQQWQYWWARANQQLHPSETVFHAIYEQLAQNRSFYGFLAADILGKPYNLQYTPSIVAEPVLQTLRSNKALMRAKELFFIDKLQDARQEWRFAIANLSPEEYQGAAQLAYEWGWYRKSIESMAAAEAWDDLRIRFPIAHETIVREQAHQSNLPATLIFAITRQESAWEVDAQSSAGAMGLMQLMPQTAKETASKAGIRHHKGDLLHPEHNITLGSRYIGELLSKYDNNRLPAIAAYNAGPRRVNQWLEQSANQLPYDIWIEVIPFGETRKYVQNVLSYSVVYAYQMGEEMSLLTQIESKKLL